MAIMRNSEKALMAFSLTKKKNQKRKKDQEQPPQFPFWFSRLRFVDRRKRFCPLPISQTLL